MHIEKQPGTLFRPAMPDRPSQRKMFANTFLDDEKGPPDGAPEADFVINMGSRGPLYSVTNSYFTITYDFPDTERDNLFMGVSMRQVMYGASEMSFRRLYIILSEAFNFREYFIDAYLLNEFQHTEENARLEALAVHTKKRIADEIQMRKNEYTKAEIKRYNVRNVRGSFTKFEDLTKKDIAREFERILEELPSADFSDFEVWGDDEMRDELKEIAESIRERIVVALSNGALPLRKTNLAPQTVQRKTSLGFTSPSAIFYASGQLIESMSIYIELTGRAA